MRNSDIKKLFAILFVLGFFEGSFALSEEDVKAKDPETLAQNVEMFLADPDKLLEEDEEGLPIFGFPKGIYYESTAFNSDVFDSRGRGHTLEKNGFEFVDFGQNKSFLEILQAFLNPQATDEEITSLSVDYEALLKKEMENWWVKKYPQDEGRIEWVPIVSGAAIIRDTSKAKKAHETRPALPLTHIDFGSPEEAIRFYREAGERQGFEVDSRLLHKRAKILTMVNVWAPLNKFCRGEPLAIVDVENLAPEDFMKVMVEPAPLPPKFGHPNEDMPPYGTWILNTDLAKIKYYSLGDWKRGEVVILETSGTPHTAYSDGSGEVRNSIELRGAFVKKSRK